MFWKKKNQDNPPLFTYDQDQSCRREFIRISPLPSMPAKLFIDDRPAELVDISAGGFSARCQGLTAGRKYAISLELHDEPNPIQTRALVLAVTGPNICHCQILDQTPEMAESIHHYVLNVQKEELRIKRELRRKNK